MLTTILYIVISLQNTNTIGEDSQEMLKIVFICFVHKIPKELKIKTYI